MPKKAMSVAMIPKDIWSKVSASVFDVYLRQKVASVPDEGQLRSVLMGLSFQSVNSLKA
jgi:hypothetical protein